jgi:hypothetical protein
VVIIIFQNNGKSSEHQLYRSMDGLQRKWLETEPLLSSLQPVTVLTELLKFLDHKLVSVAVLMLFTFIQIICAKLILSARYVLTIHEFTASDFYVS